MSVRQLGTQVAKAVGQQLESLGFQRQRTVYRRERPGFVERFAIVGDRWNSGAAPWRFSVDVGIYFPDLPTHPIRSGSGARRMRLEQLGRLQKRLRLSSSKSVHCR